MSSQPQKNTSWQAVSDWYGQEVGQKGHFYHQAVIWPYLKSIWQLNDQAKVLDLGCGQGVLARELAAQSIYVGLDLSRGLIDQAKIADKATNHYYWSLDVTQSVAAAPKIALVENSFTHAAMILSAQNMEHPNGAITNAAKFLRSSGELVLVLNHPCFRIPRQSSWGVDEANKTQYRRVDRYLTPLSVPIAAHPGQDDRSSVTWSFHFPISQYCHWLQAAGFWVQDMAELTSSKTSQGKAAKMENRSRQEFPLFLAVRAVKK